MKDKKLKVHPKDVRKTPLIYVEWEDACGHAAWNHPEESKLVQVASIGYLVFEDEKVVTVSCSLNSMGQSGPCMTIPKAWILFRKTVKNKAHGR